ncbi:PGF-pre-PGF domain-containing protein [Candidatus Woesearchaeota archaeon]|nr:PGF-pre-PGF domain-containing protein [Candidatus Woesearchaeota archaeon]
MKVRRHNLVLIILIIVFSLLLVITTIEAVQVYFSGLNIEKNMSDTLRFNATVDLVSLERLPLTNLTLSILSQNSSYSYNCTFDIFADHSCDNIAVDMINNPMDGYGYGYLFGYGPGYDPYLGSGDYNSTFGYGYGYGYNQTIFEKFSYNISWTVPDLEGENLTFSLEASAKYPYTDDIRRYESQGTYYLYIQNTCIEPTDGLVIPSGSHSMCIGEYTLTQPIIVQNDTRVSCNNQITGSEVFKINNNENITLVNCSINGTINISYSSDITLENNTLGSNQDCVILHNSRDIWLTNLSIINGEYGILAQDSVFDLSASRLSGLTVGLGLTRSNFSDITDNSIDAEYSLILNGATGGYIRNNNLSASKTNMILSGVSGVTNLSSNNFLTGLLNLNNSQNVTIPAATNYWGTENDSNVRLGIIDYLDDSALGQVNYLPYAMSAYPDNRSPNITIEYPEDGTRFAYSNNVVDLNISIDEPGNCRYSTNADFNFSNGSSFTYNLFSYNKTIFVKNATTIEDVGENVYYYKCQDTVGNEKSFSHTIIRKSSSNRNGGGSPLIMKVADPTTNKFQKYITSLKKGETVLIAPKDMSIGSIEFGVTESASNIDFILEEFEANPSGIDIVPETVYKFIEISHDNLADGIVENVKISFKVLKSWLKSRDLSADDIVLMRYSSGEWKSLQTTYMDSDEDYYFFLAISPGLSVFAISSTKNPITPNPSQDPVPVTPPQSDPHSESNTNSSSPMVTGTPVQKTFGSYDLTWLFWTLGIIVVLGVTIVLTIMHWDQLGLILYDITATLQTRSDNKIISNNATDGTQTRIRFPDLGFGMKSGMKSGMEFGMESGMGLGVELNPFLSPEDEMKLTIFLKEAFKRTDADPADLHQKLLQAGWTHTQIDYTMNKFRR